MRAIYIVVGVAFLMLGVVGLIIPVIPGILFLAAAIYVLGKVSKRVRSLGQRNAMYRDMSRRFDRLQSVGVLDRVRVVPLMLLDMAVTGLDRLATAATRLFGRLA